jgi:hypothetical protein
MYSDPTMQRDAVRRAQAARYASRRVLIDQIKSVPCADCGGSFPPECMDFDHISDDKFRKVSWMMSSRIDKLMAEVDKCEIVCSNCHRIRTKKRMVDLD